MTLTPRLRPLPSMAFTFKARRLLKDSSLTWQFFSHPSPSPSASSPSRMLAFRMLASLVAGTLMMASGVVCETNAARFKRCVVIVFAFDTRDRKR